MQRSQNAKKQNSMHPVHWLLHFGGYSWHYLWINQKNNDSEITFDLTGMWRGVHFSVMYLALFVATGSLCLWRCWGCVRPADGPGGFLTDPVDIHLDTRGHVALSGLTYTYFYFHRAHTNNIMIYLVVRFCYQSWTCAAVQHLLPFPYLVIYLFISTPLSFWTRRVTWLEINKNLCLCYRLCNPPPKKKQTLVAHFSSAHFTSIDAVQSKTQTADTPA